MSGASAMASARRRRAVGNNEPVNIKQTNNTPSQNNKPTDNQTKQQTNHPSQNNDIQKLTPLQILQLHSAKITELENIDKDKTQLNELITNRINTILNEKFNHMNTQFATKEQLESMNTQYATKEQLESMNSQFVTKEQLESMNSQFVTNTNLDQTNNTMQLLETNLKTHVTSICEMLSKLNNNVAVISETQKQLEADKESLINTLDTKISTFVDNSLVTKMSNINDTIKTMLVSIDKVSGLNNLNESNTEKIDNLINELNSLKSTVIHNQTIELDTNNEILNMKNSILTLTENIDILSENNENRNTTDPDNPEENEFFNMNNDAVQMLFKSMMGGASMDNLNGLTNLNELNDLNDINDLNNNSKINIHEGDEDIESNNSVNEITISESDLQHIKDEIIEEIKEIKETSPSDTSKITINMEDIDSDNSIM
jgi:hypothetical protein